MEINFQKELGKNYMVLEGGATRSEYAFRVISENEIKNILKVETSRVDGRVRYYYDIDGLISLEKCFYRRSMAATDVETVLRAIVSTPDSLEEYLLNKDNVILSPETIFFSSDFEKVYLCYFPDSSSSYLEGIKETCMFFLKKIDHQDAEAVTLTYGAFEISSRETFAISELEALLKKEGEAAPEVAEKPSMSFDDLLELREDTENIEYSDFDYYEEEEELPEYKEEKEENIKKKNMFKIVPALLIVIAGVVLFGLDVTSGMSLALRIGCFSMISVATLLLTYLLWMKEKGA